MSAAVYLRTCNQSNGTTVRLVCAKTRVAPLKQLTILRLELTATFLLAYLIVQAVKSLELSNAPVFL